LSGKPDSKSHGKSFCEANNINRETSHLLLSISKTATKNGTDEILGSVTIIISRLDNPSYQTSARGILCRESPTAKVTGNLFAKRTTSIAKQAICCCQPVRQQQKTAPTKFSVLQQLLYHDWTIPRTKHRHEGFLLYYVR